MADFEALNELRSQTLRQIREMLGEDAALWARYFDGSNASEIIAHIEGNRAGFRALWEQHDRVRKQMVEAGFLPPPGPANDVLWNSVEAPSRQAVEDRLKADLELAREEYYFASREFRLFVVQGTGLPAPDGSLCAKQIAAEHSAALRRYTNATRRFSAFLTDGKLPEE